MATRYFCDRCHSETPLQSFSLIIGDGISKLTWKERDFCATCAAVIKAAFAAQLPLQGATR